MRLKLFTHIASEHGLSSVTTLVVGSSSAVLINPPLLLQDAQSVVSFVKLKTSNPVTAVFVSDYHSDHYFGVDIILEAYPDAKFFAAPYVTAAIDTQLDDQGKFWSEMFGSNRVTSKPTKPEMYNYSFFALPGDMTSPIILLGPVQGSSPHHTLFWLPTERTIVTGDAVFARSTHVSMEEVDNAVSLSAWRLTLDLIYSLDPVTIVTGHIEKGMQFDARKDMEHMYRYLDLFEEKVLRPMEQGKLHSNAQELYQTFEDAFPNSFMNVDFYLGRTARRFGGSGCQPPYDSSQRSMNESSQDMEGFIMAV